MPVREGSLMLKEEYVFASRNSRGEGGRNQQECRRRGYYLRSGYSRAPGTPFNMNKAGVPTNNCPKK
jgi:hypothetical protein